MVSALVAMAKEVAAEGADYAIAHADEGAAAEAEYDRKLLLGEQGDDANNAGQKIEIIKKLNKSLEGEPPSTPLS
jgi:hypothetical protein